MKSDVLRPGGLRGALAAEWRKVRRQRFPLVAMGLVLAATILTGLWAEDRDLGFPVNGFWVLCESAHWGFWTAGFMVLLYAASSVAGEATAGTLKLVLVRPIGRIQFVLAKAVFLVLFALLLALLVSTAAWILGYNLGGYGDIMEMGLGDDMLVRLEAERVADKPLTALAMCVLPLLAYGMLGLLISTLTTNSATAVTSAVLVCMPLLYILPVAFPESEAYLFTHYATHYLDLAAEFAKGFDERWDFELLQPGLIVPPVYVLVLLGAALVIFRRKDVAL